MSYIAKNGRLYTSGASEALTLLDDKFSVNKSYSKGDSCIYNDYLWKFTSNKPAGEWDNTVVEQCRIMDFVDDVNGRLTQVQSQIVPTASIEMGETASKAYSVGDFLVKNGVLYKVTNAIVKGDTLTVGTNIVMTTVGGELSKIKSNLTDRVQLSLDAVAVGKDEDGDTIYEKTFKGTTISSGTVIDSSLTFSNLKWIHFVGGCFNNADAEMDPVPYATFFRVRSTSKGLTVIYTDVNVKMYHFTVQYVLK